MIFTPLTGRFWRAVFEGDEDHLIKPARGRCGRWHYDGQPAIYCSDVPDGCRVSINSFATAEDPKWIIYPVDVQADRIVDLREPEARKVFNTDLPSIHAFWNDYLARGETSPTWILSDRLRDAGAQGILAPSRSRPELTHLTLFDWNTENGALAEAQREQGISF